MNMRQIDIPVSKQTFTISVAGAITPTHAHIRTDTRQYHIGLYDLQAARIQINPIAKLILHRLNETTLPYVPPILIGVRDASGMR